MPEVNGVSLPFLPPGGVEQLRARSIPPVRPDQPQSSFKDIFDQEISRLKFSAHAQSRMTSREISLSQEDITKLETAVNKAESKGAKESLVVMNNMAFIVNIPNKTVITAVQSDQMKENVFTNIDSAVFA